MDKVAKQLCLDFMAQGCCTLPFYDLESKRIPRIPRILLSYCIVQIHRYPQLHLLLLPSFLHSSSSSKKNRPSMHAFFLLSLYPKSQLGNPLIISSSSFVRSGSSFGVFSEMTIPLRRLRVSWRGWSNRSGAGARKAAASFFLFTRTETSDYLLVITRLFGFNRPRNNR